VSEREHSPVSKKRAACLLLTLTVLSLAAFFTLHHLQQYAPPVTTSERLRGLAVASTAEEARILLGADALA
jgi:hypothetical protein